MAIVQSIAVGKAKGSAGNVTFSTVKGRVIMKEKPIFVANPQTEAQMAQRSALTRTLKLWQKIGFLAKDGWTRLNTYASPYNQFLSNNIPFVKELPGTTEDILDQNLKGLQISSGRLKEIEFNDDFQWDFNDGILSSDIYFSDDLKAGDKIKCVGFSPAAHKSYVSESTLTTDNIEQGQLSVNIKVPTTEYCSAFLVAVYAVSADGKFSSSSYFQ